MTGAAFNRYMARRTAEQHLTWLPDHDPAVEFFDGTVRIFDQRGESCAINGAKSRQLRVLATQLRIVADEIDRREYEDQ